MSLAGRRVSRRVTPGIRTNWKSKIKPMTLTLLATDWFLLLEKCILILIIISISLLVAMYETYAERKVAAFMQDRRGPNRAGPGGILQPLADGLKLFMKEEIIPLNSNRFLFVLGPGLAMLTALVIIAVSIASPGPSTNKNRLEFNGMISSFMNSFNPSASGCKIPPGPALFGPRLSCMNAATFLSAYVSYIATRSDMLMMISISMH